MMMNLCPLALGYYPVIINQAFRLHLRTLSRSKMREPITFRESNTFFRCDAEAHIGLWSTNREAFGFALRMDDFPTQKKKEEEGAKREDWKAIRTDHAWCDKKL